MAILYQNLCYHTGHVFRQIGLGKQCKPSSLIRVYTVCNSICIFLTKNPKIWLLYLNLGILQQSFVASENLGTLRYSEAFYNEVDVYD